MRIQALGIVTALWLSACITPYYLDLSYKDAKMVTDAIPALPKMAYMSRENSAVQKQVSENHDVVQARCILVSNAMMVEKEDITKRNRILGAAWAGITTGLTFANGIYNIAAKDQANSTVSAVLGIAAGGTSIPTFFFFGSDKRADELDSKIAQIKEGLATLHSLDGEQSKVVIETAATAAQPGVIANLKCRQLELQFALDMKETDLCGRIESDRAKYRKDIEESAKNCNFNVPESRCSDHAKSTLLPNAKPTTKPELDKQAAELKEKETKAKNQTELQTITEKLAVISMAQATAESSNNKAVEKINAAVNRLQLLCR